MTKIRLSRGFTLTEMLIVIGIIVLVVFIAVPSFKALSGGRSTEAAQNVLSGVLGRARAEAIGLQKISGVAFFPDPGDNTRTLVYQVRESAFPSTFPPGAPAVDVFLDFVPDRDPVPLPNGVGVQTVDDVELASAGVRKDDGYIGFNTAVGVNGVNVTYGGVILFNSLGQVVSKGYAFKCYDESPGGRKLPNVFSRTMEMTIPTTGNPVNLYPPAPPDSAGQPRAERSQFGFVLYDLEGFANHVNEATGNGTTPNDPQFASPTVAYTADERDEEKWLDENSTPILINRNNGTLLRGS